jgi:hypothetical protein
MCLSPTRAPQLTIQLVEIPKFVSHETIENNWGVSAWDVYAGGLVSTFRSSSRFAY